MRMWVHVKNRCLHCQLMKEQKSLMHCMVSCMEMRIKGSFTSRRQYSVVLNIRLQYCAWRNNPFEIFELSNFALQRHDDIMFNKYTQYIALSTATTTTTMTTISALISISFSNRSIIIIVNWYHCCCAPEQLKLESPPATLFMFTGTWKLQGINLCNIVCKIDRIRATKKLTMCN